MDEDEAALLAELRAISAGAAGTSRFNNNGDEDNTDLDMAPDDLTTSSNQNSNAKQSAGDGLLSSQSKSTNSSKTEPCTNQRAAQSRPVPPWNRERANQKANALVGVEVVAAPAPSRPVQSEPNPPAAMEDEPSGGFQKSKSSFQGERGGDADDAKLLAELRAISNQSGAANRFVGEDEEGADGFDDPPATSRNDLPTTGNPARQRQQRPEISRNRFDKRGMDVLVSSHSEDQETVSVLSEPSTFASAGGFHKSKEISAQSAGTDGFAQNDVDEAIPQAEPQAVAEVTDEKVEERALPPWKRKGNQAKSSQHKDSNKQAQTIPPWKRKPGAKAQPTSSGADVDVVVAAPEPAVGGFQKSATPKTFQGDRGGSAEDEDLLAELRAISSKPGAADRFAGEDEEATEAEPQPAPAPAPAEPASPFKSAQKTRDQGELPPWKRKGQSGNNNSHDEGILSDNSLPPWKGKGVNPNQSNNDVVVAAPLAPTPQLEPEPMGCFQKPSLPNTFKGDRGGAAEDEDLLAELKAISVGAGGASRFAEGDEEGGAGAGDAGGLQSDPAPPVRQPPSKPKPNPSNSLPPWKRKGAKPNQPTDDVVVAAPPAPPPVPTPASLVGVFQKPSLPNTFKGDRGGAAEDEDLLAELRAISAGAEGATRFAEDDEEGVAGDAGGFQRDPPPPMKQPPSKPKPNSNNSLPPWKRKGAKPNEPTGDVMVSAPPAPAPPPEPTPASLMGGFQKPMILNTFKGDRGGAAEDEDLLAELRAISAGAGGANRFTEDGDEGRVVDAGGISNPAPPARQPPAKPKSNPNNSQPPWKTKAAKPNQSSNDVVVAAPPFRTQPSEAEPMGGFQKSSLPNTFKGDHGGAAEDDDLLAELRAISAGTGGANRFEVDEEEGVQDSGGFSDPSPPVQQPPSKLESNSLPPWKKGAKPNQSSNDVVGAAPPQEPITASPMRGFQKSNTFKGDRGGAAEDEDLLAELRAISAGTSGANRFLDPEDTGKDQQEQPVAPPSSRPKLQGAQPPKPQPAHPTAGPKLVETTASVPAANLDSTLTLNDLPAALTDKSWKLRKEAFELLKRVLDEQVADKEPNGDVNASALVEGLDSLIPGMLKDSNASALDSALEFSLLYADHCIGATMTGQADEMVSALVTGSALSSSRPSTVKSISALVLKLIEVGQEGTSSAHAVIDVLLRQGLTSKKPKIVLTSSGLILLATTSFGASCLPLAQVNASAPKMLTQSNAKVRDSGLKIVAEVARALGSTSHIKVIIDGMKKAQVDQLNGMLEKQPKPTPPTITFRSQQGTSAPGSPEDALAALEAGNKEMQAKRFAARPAVNVVAEVAKSEFSTRIALPKWSEKAAALDKVMELGGEKPYKLMEPSPSVNYAPLISDMKKLLAHTHFAVCGKSMQVLSMLAEGVGPPLFPHLRPLLGNLLALNKDKKLTKFIGPCLDSCFGRILSFDHLLEADALPEGLNEKKQKNALARTAALGFLGRCVTRRSEAGPRGTLSVKSAKRVTDLSISKLEDSDAGVRKAALSVLQNLQSVDDEEVAMAVNDIIDGLKKTNARAHKTLSKTMKKPSAASAQSKEPKMESQQSASARSPRKPASRPAPQEKPSSLPKLSARAPPPLGPKQVVDEPSQDAMPLDDALDQLAQMGLPNFDGPEDDGGVLAGLQSTKWASRQNALRNIAAFIETAEDIPAGRLSTPLMVAVKEHTRGFKETNVNVTKAILEFFIEICDFHYRCTTPLGGSAMKDVVGLAVDKVADRKLSALAKGLLTSTCLVCRPLAVVDAIAARVEKIKTPLPHEECQKWFKVFCNDFGASSLGSGVKDVVAWLLKEASSNNVKVKKASFNSIGRLHAELGPIIKALLFSQCQDSMRNQLEKTLESHAFDPSSANAEWPKVSIAGESSSKQQGQGRVGDDDGDMGLALEIPRMDLFASLSADCLTKMTSKEGKTAWKLRKQAIDEVDAALKKCSALIDSSSQCAKQLGELVRTLRDRLSDSQGNLKPISARVIGSLLSVTDKVAQPKLGKLVYGPLINGAISDIKKPTREASLEALRLSTTVSSIEGGGVNKDGLEAFVNSMASELNDTAMKAIGLPELLEFAISFADQLPNLDDVAARGQSLGEKTAAAFVKCLTSSKSETRSKAETLLTICVKNGVLSLDRIKSCTERMKPAQQRSVGPIMAKLARALPSGEKENVPDSHSEAPIREPVRNNGKPPGREATRKPEHQTNPASRATADKQQFAQGGGQKPRSPRSEAPTHPLIPTSGPVGQEKSRAALRSMTWPEYPEEPLGSDIFNQLKRAWVPILPSTNVASFFPSGGVRKQDDGKGGCELIAKAILMERAGEGVAIEEQLELIFRWMVIVLCSKEHTVGLQALLSSLSDLFVYLREIKYELSDSEALLLIPFVLEKASLAKGRFKDVFDDLIVEIKAEDVLPMKRLGSIVAAAMIERAPHAKARLAACQDCSRCVDQLGLSGIGKKGVLVAAKALSEENLSENRTACLDLMELVLARMNGDIQRLARICGSSLSDKARRLIEERWSRPRTNPPVRQREDSSARRSKIPTPIKASPSEKAPGSSHALAPTRASPKPVDPGTGTVLHDELPALVLRHKTIASPPAKDYLRSKSDPPANNFLPKYNSYTENTFSVPSMPPDDESSFNRGHAHAATPPTSLSVSKYNHASIPAPKPSADRESFGAAASLRARLMKIREKSKNPDMSVVVPTEDKATPELRNEPQSSPVRNHVVETHEYSPLASASQHSPLGQRSSEYAMGLGIINGLLNKSTPLAEGDKDLDEGIECMKKFHSALSKQQSVVVGLSSEELSMLRQSIVDDVDEMIERLSRLMSFSLDCEVPSRSAGISISLLSVCLATLMALFRDHDLAVRVSKERLSLLIRETGTALLDSRLVVSSQTSSLDEATSTQVVRAINKLAVQAATGGSREASLSALMTLQRQLSFEASPMNSRLSRVVTKLFTRVTKAEDAKKSPWQSVEIRELLRTLNIHFAACDDQEDVSPVSDRDSIQSCRRMARSLVESLAKSSGGTSMRDEMLRSGIDPSSSPLGRVAVDYIAADDLHEQSPVRPQTPSRGVATLVSALVGAQSQEDRDGALRALRQYTSEYGDEELNSHLEQVSPAFRNFILEQLSLQGQGPMEDESEASNRQQLNKRLRNLRSRLHAKEAPTSVPTPTEPPRAHLGSGLVPPSRSRGPAPASHSAASVDTASMSTRSTGSSNQSLRERLAAAQENRKNSLVTPETSSTSGSRAAALRARLQAVKQQAMQN